MRVSDYFRLGNISVKSRKKSTRNTVAGISFGLIILIPVLFLTFIAYFSLDRQINVVRTIAAFTVASQNYYGNAPEIIASYNEDGYLDTEGLLSYDSVLELADNDDCKEKLVYNSLTVNNVSVRLGDGDYINISPMAGSVNIRVCAVTQSDGKYYSDAEAEDAGGSIFSAGGGFTDKYGALGKKQVILSEALFTLDGIKLNSELLVGESISLRTTYSPGTYVGASAYIDNDTIPGNGFDYSQNTQPVTVEIARDFEIAGIVKQDFLKLPSRFTDSFFWITDNSLYYEAEDGKQSLLPEINLERTGGGYEEFYAVATYPAELLSLADAAAARGVIVPLFPAVTFNNNGNWWGQAISSQTFALNAYTTLQPERFGNSLPLAARVRSALQKVYPESSASDLDNMFMSPLYTFFNSLFGVIQIIMTIFYLFGGIIFFATMLSLYNSMHYSVQVRRNYIGVMRAVGAKSRMIPTMYLIETAIIFLRSLIFVLPISLLICLGAKLLMEYAISSVAIQSAYFVFTTSLWYYLPAFAILYGVCLLIAVVFSQGACNAVSRRPILNILRNEG